AQPRIRITSPSLRPNPSDCRAAFSVEIYSLRIQAVATFKPSLKFSVKLVARCSGNRVYELRQQEHSEKELLHHEHTGCNGNDANVSEHVRQDTYCEIDSGTPKRCFATRGDELFPQSC